MENEGEDFGGLSCAVKVHVEYSVRFDVDESGHRENTKAGLCLQDGGHSGSTLVTTVGLNK